MQKRPHLFRLNGRALYLTSDLALLQDQLAGKTLCHNPQIPLIDNISTDEITPGWVCFWYDETLGDYCLVGLRGNHIQKDTIKHSGAKALVSGLSKGCGSSRETAPYSEKVAGIELIVAHTIEKIYGQNCRNIGLLITTDFGILERLEHGESVPLFEFTKGLDDISAGIVEYGGLFAYNLARLSGQVSPPPVLTSKRPMTLVEKIIARHALTNAATGEKGIAAVKPGDAMFCHADIRFSHEYVTPMAESLFVSGFGKEAHIKNPESVFAFRDHLTFLSKVMPESQKQKGLLLLADKLAHVQETFVARQGIKLYGEHPNGGSEAICHNAVLEELARPGQLVIGTDSHTCTAGALGCFAFGVGATDMANAWLTQDIQVQVPASVRYDLIGKPSQGVCAKDVMLYLMSQDYIRSGKAIGKVLELGGEGLQHFNVDERATLANMAVEAGATTGIIIPDDITANYLMHIRGYTQEQAYAGFLTPDEHAEYDARFTINLGLLKPMVALPGDPRNGVPVQSLTTQSPVHIDIAYGGSCTGGKMADMDMYAEVLATGLKYQHKVKEGVQLYIQFGSQRIKQYAEKMGYLAIFNQAGAHIIEPSCGACIKAGPGVSEHANQVTVSAINRNFPGRSGPGHVYLASPRVVAASALAGYITTPENLFPTIAT